MQPILRAHLLRFKAMEANSGLRAQNLPKDLFLATTAVAQSLVDHGHVAYIVGGALRNLALCKPATDLDMATDATPAEIEAIFKHTKAVGRAFGTVLVRVHGVELELTTFREERGYSDHRHPTQVEFGHSLEADAKRRDFTCNALYLDPLNNELHDPAQGAIDLEQRRLRCVGVAAERFREDGLRIVRMARFSAAYGLEVEAGTMAAAKSELNSLAGVSPERVRAELHKIFSSPKPAWACEMLCKVGAMARLIPAWLDSNPAESFEQRRWKAMAQLEIPVPLAVGLAVLAYPQDAEGEWDSSKEETAQRILEGLRLSKAEFESVRTIWEYSMRIDRLPSMGQWAEGDRADCIRMLRNRNWDNACKFKLAWLAGLDKQLASLEELMKWRAGLGEDELFPAPLLASEDFLRAGLPRGPLWGIAARELEQLQLDLALGTRAAALQWLERRSAQWMAQEDRAGD